MPRFGIWDYDNTCLCKGNVYVTRRETTDIRNPLVIHPPADWKPRVFTDKEHGWMLPEKAKIFGAGCWQAPTLSFLSNRMFLDISQHKLPAYPIKLQDTYVIIDHRLARKPVKFFVLSKKVDL